MKRLIFWLVMPAFAALPAFASGITFDCDTITASVCTTLQTTIAGQYASLFTNATAVIDVQTGSVAGDVAENSQYYNTVSYQSYYNALKTNASAPGGSAAALASLPTPACIPNINGVICNNPLNGNPPLSVSSLNYGISLTSSLDAALGLSGAIGISSTGGACTAYTTAAGVQAGIGIGTSAATSCFNDVITVSNSASFYYDTGQYVAGEYDFFSAVEHETDEALGTASCIANTNSGVTPTLSTGCTNSGAGVSAADLFRYSAPGVRSFIGTNGNQAEGSTAYFSIDGGITDIAMYNNVNNGDDYGDWLTNSSTACKFVQNAAGCNSSSGAGLNITNDGGPEVDLLNAVGYTLTPEPGSIVMFTLGLGMLATLRKFRRA